MKKHPKIKFLLIIFVISALSIVIVKGQSEEGKPGFLTNQLNPYDGADPWLQYYEGNYYLATTTWTSELIMLKSPSLAGLKTAIPIQIYAETEPSRCCNMWAPEFHLLDGPDGLRWYYYYSAGTSGTLDNQHTHVLESEGTDPMGPYHYKARIFDPSNDVWAIDGSILQLDGKLYFLFSSWVGSNQNLFIAPMSNPWTISGPRVQISQPTYDWERIGGNTNEGPEALYHNGDVFIVFSASSCATPDYALGLLTYNGGDPLDPNSWEKHPEPIFRRSDENGVFAPGHNGFFMSPDGSENWIVYHANSSEQGGCDSGRSTRVQRFTWNDDGTPNLGVPISPDTVIAAPSGDMGVDPIPNFGTLEISLFRSLSYKTGYLRHSDIYGRIDVNVSPIADAEFWVLPGLADPKAVSIRAINLPGYFLRHENNAIVFSPYDGTEEFAQSATWWMRDGLADSDWISFEAYNQSGFYISSRFGVMALVEDNDSMTDTMREDATFLEEQNQ